MLSNHGGDLVVYPNSKPMEAIHDRKRYLEGKCFICENTQLYWMERITKLKYHKIMVDTRFAVGFTNSCERGIYKSITRIENQLVKT